MAEREQEKTIEWYKARAKETTDLKRAMFHLWKDDKPEVCDEYFPDRVARKYKQLEKFAERIMNGQYCGQKDCPAYPLTLARNVLAGEPMGRCAGHVARR